LNPVRRRAQANALLATQTIAALALTPIDTPTGALSSTPTLSIPPSQTAPQPAATLPTSTQAAEEIPATDTLSPTHESSPTPTVTLPAEDPPPPQTDGDLFAMYYDETGFYIKNLSGKDRSVYPLAFEQLDKDGKPVKRVEGWYWGNIYSKFRADYCLVLEILTRTDHLSPPECKNRYLVIRTPTYESGMIFWIKEKNYREFRVLWDDDEVGRCKIAEQYCEVYLP
jgi:hypothetical protein